MIIMVKDIVCGMDINESSSIKEEHEGKDYYFCSESCKNQFNEDPKKFLDKSEGCCN